MGVLASAFERRSLANPEQWLWDSITGPKSYTGKTVNPEVAQGYTAFLACQKVLAESIASLPLVVYERTASGKRRATEHPLYKILHNRPNPKMTSFVFRETAMVHLTGWGNFYSEVRRNGAGQVEELWPLSPNKVRRVDEGRGTHYELEVGMGEKKIIPASAMLHVMGLSLDGKTGISPVTALRQAIGLGLAMEEFDARFFANDAKPGAILEHPGVLGPEAHANLRRDFEEKYSGLSNKHRVAILEEGMKLHEVGVNLKDAQFLQSRLFQLNEIARAFRVPPHMVGDLERSTFSNIDAQDISFSKHTLRPWLVRWEQAMVELFAGTDRDRFFTEFVVDGLERGDPEKRMMVYRTMRELGIMSANDIAAKENINTLPDGSGDDYWRPANMQIVGQESAQTQQRSIETRALPRRLAAADAHTEKLIKRFESLIDTESADLIRMAASIGEGQAFSDWVADYYLQREGVYLDEISPALLALAADVIDAASADLGVEPEPQASFQQNYINRAATRYREDGTQKVTEATRGKGVKHLMGLWAGTRAAQLARAEVGRLSNGLALKVFSATGVRRKIWRTRGKNCPICNKFDGRTVELEGYFFQGGDTISFKGEDGVQQKLKVKKSLRHPPLHKGCDCFVAPG